MRCAHSVNSNWQTGNQSRRCINISLCTINPQHDPFLDQSCLQPMDQWPVRTWRRIACSCSYQTQLVKNSSHLFWMRQTEGASDHLPSLCWTVLPITNVFYQLFTKWIREIHLTDLGDIISCVPRYKKKAFKMIQETKNKFWEDTSMSVKHKTESSSSEKSNQRQEHQSNENIIKSPCMWRYQNKECPKWESFSAEICFHDVLAQHSTLYSAGLLGLACQQ